MNVIYFKEDLSKRFTISELYHSAILSFWNIQSLEATTRCSGFEHLFNSSIGSLLMLTSNNGLDLLGCLLSCMRIRGVHGFCFLLL